MFRERRLLQADLNIFLSLVTTLIVIGFLFIYSSSSVYALEKLGSAHYFVKKHSFGLLLGIIAGCVTRYLPLDLIKVTSPLLFFTSLILTTMTMLTPFAQRIHGSSRWLNLGGLVFQPSELLKMSLLIYIAYFLTKKERYKKSFMYGYLPFLIILGISCGLLLKQPDFGLAATLGATTFILLFIAQFNTSYLVITVAAALPGLIGLVYFFPYRWKRIMTFLNPWQDPQGAGFQIIQSLIAIGSGSMWGAGISHSKQKFFYLPMQHTDFIFSIIAEETGFVGSTLIVILYVLFTYYGMRIAWRMKDTFSVFVTLGFVILTSMQAVINLLVTTGLVPTKGVGLPFISYGNSALICSLAMIGLIINCTNEQRL
ncbi:putative lipid II flippase FtsW [Candidatus Babeliales bacterium]|nr:putative lipid II flippase FtsW [Candidatus Babeliales bacterium]